MLLKLNADVRTINLGAYVNYIAWAPNQGYFPEEPGKNHHKLLSYLCKQLPDKSLAADLGTFLGASALALASNSQVKVLTFDLAEMGPNDLTIPTYRNLPNVRFVKGDCANYIDAFIDAKLIMLDIDPHDGVQEPKMVKLLLEKEYKGILICDDIHLNKEMQNWWDSVTLKKIDATKYGHWSGTGIIVFAPEIIDVSMD